MAIKKAPTTRTLFVRVCPYDARRGFLVRSFARHGLLITSDWKEIPMSRVAEMGLAEMRQDSGQKIFQVCTKEEALNVLAGSADTSLEYLLNASKSKDVVAQRVRSQAAEEEIKRLAAISTSNATEALLAELEANVIAQANEEAEEEARESNSPPPAPTPKKRKRKNKE